MNNLLYFSIVIAAIALIILLIKFELKSKGRTITQVIKLAYRRLWKGF